jgi:hypothetical protein
MLMCGLDVMQLAAGVARCIEEKRGAVARRVKVSVEVGLPRSRLNRQYRNGMQNGTSPRMLSKPYWTHWGAR